MIVDAVDSVPGLEPCPYCGHEHADTLLKCPVSDMVLPFEGRILEGKFRFIKALGKGGMASVWLALNTQIDRHVAIKLIRPEVARSEEMMARFRSEARAAGRVGHPNVCDILDSGVGSVGPYIVMEYMRGRNLGQLLTAERRVDPLRAVTLIRPALAGLAAAHDRGIIHRDLKPENVFLQESPDGGEPIVKLVDFGVAKFIDGTGEATTEHGALLGTPEYMAPEQFRGARLADHRTDIWAMGAILYRALAGRHPFRGATVAATLLMVTHDDPAPIRELAPEVPQTMIDIVMRCLAKEPRDRYSTVRELDADLERFVAMPQGAASLHAVAEVSDRLSVDPEPESISLRSSLSSADLEDVEASQPGASDPALGSGVRPWEGAERRSSLDVRALWVLGAIAAAGALAVYLLSNPTAPFPSRSVTSAPRINPSVPIASDVEASGFATPAMVENAEHATDGSLPAAADTGSAGEQAAGESGPSPPASARTPPSPPTVPTLPAPEPGIEGDTDGPTPGDVLSSPAGTLRLEEWVTPTARPPKRTHADARRYCETLGQTAHLGIHGWQLANPAMATKLADTAGVPAGRYWTSARHKGRALVVDIPRGSKDSINAERRSARPLCIARWP